MPKDKPVRIKVEVRGGLIQQITPTSIPSNAIVKIRVIDYDGLQNGDPIVDYTETFKGKDVR